MADDAARQARVLLQQVEEVFGADAHDLGRLRGGGGKGPRALIEHGEGAELLSGRGLKHLDAVTAGEHRPVEEHIEGVRRVALDEEHFAHRVVFDGGEGGELGQNLR